MMYYCFLYKSPYPNNTERNKKTTLCIFGQFRICSDFYNSRRAIALDAMVGRCVRNGAFYL